MSVQPTGPVKSLSTDSAGKRSLLLRSPAGTCPGHGKLVRDQGLWERSPGGGEQGVGGRRPREEEAEGSRGSREQGVLQAGVEEGRQMTLARPRYRATLSSSVLSRFQSWPRGGGEGGWRGGGVDTGGQGVGNSSFSNIYSDALWFEIKFQ